jgi:hypothetical protein
MNWVPAETQSAPATGQLLLASVTARGSGAHPYASSDALLRGPDAARNLADLIHFLCILHGRHPGVVDHAADSAALPEAQECIAAAAAVFTAERTYLARLAAAAGPVPSTPGAADSDSVVRAQRHAIEMLARSERRGCATGAAMAVLLDWSSVRHALDCAAERFGVEAAPRDCDIDQLLIRTADAIGEQASVQRALLFGAEQIVLQHHGLWDLLEARQEARVA